ncbi:MAG TPA: glutamine-hydrolyzing carbamoyl-phosphate synthase small subunit [Planctomycetota bacterium]|nr:glutamine-hydrolyzing carbamoyl-phosphate synthase small subunit [Planctomycetota bacterium]
MAARTPPPCLLVFEDGDVYRGTHFGWHGESCGEVVFNTALSGYEEVLTDPSYEGQLVVMTYPLIGNYGVNLSDMESPACYLEGFVIKELSPRVSNFRSSGDLSSWLAGHKIVGLQGVDTRAIVFKVRQAGSLRAIISSVDQDAASLLDKVRAWPGLNGVDVVKGVTCARPMPWTEGLDGAFLPRLEAGGSRTRPRLAVYDYGIKRNMLRGLVASGFDVTVFPATTPAGAILEHAPDCLFLSNGPGDPEPLRYAIDAIRTLVNTGLPTFGICLGHQLTAFALGGRTVKMKFGHHGANQPVIDLTTGKTEITSQNHSYMVDPKSLDEGMVEITHENLNDRTVEGLRHRELPLFTVQYHPEAAPGPRDAFYLFRRFRDLVDERMGAAR